MNTTRRFFTYLTKAKNLSAIVDNQEFPEVEILKNGHFILLIFDVECWLLASLIHKN
jgi:hypothetical protein